VLDYLNPGEKVVWQNTVGGFLATKVEKLQSHGYGRPIDEITFSNAIASNRFSGFAVTT
jgi:hypothetical protein